MQTGISWILRLHGPWNGFYSISKRYSCLRGSYFLLESYYANLLRKIPQRFSNKITALNCCFPLKSLFSSSHKTNYENKWNNRTSKLIVYGDGTSTVKCLMAIQRTLLPFRFRLDDVEVFRRRRREVSTEVEKRRELMNSLTLNVSTYSWWTYEVFIAHWSLILNNARFIWMEIAHFGRFSIRICKTYYFSVRAYVRVCAIVSVVSRMRKTRNGKIGRYNLRLRMIFYMIMQVDLSTSKGSLFAFKLLWNYVWLCNHSNSIFAAIR